MQKRRQQERLPLKNHSYVIGRKRLFRGKGISNKNNIHINKLLIKRLKKNGAENI